MDDITENRPPALVIAGGDLAGPLPDLDEHAYVVAVDGGLRHAVRLGIAPDVIVGDLDSVDGAQLASAIAAGVVVERHDVDKDATDWELALHHVRKAGYRSVVIVGGGGGRLDHLVANALTLASGDYSDLHVVWHIGPATVRVARPGSAVEIQGRRGDTVTLLAVGGEATGVTTSGLRWPLVDGVLPSGSSLGVSNELIEEEATITTAAGTLLIIHERAQP